MAEYAEFVGMAEADTELLLRVCKLIHQDTRQLRGLKGLYEQEVTLIEQYLQLSSEDAPSLASSYPPRVHLLAAVQTYIQFGEKSWQAKIPHLNAQAIEPFRNFLLNRTVHARELLLVPPPFTDSPLPLDDRSSKKIFEEVAEEKGLTVREKEVLELVVRAMNNKQIGKHLFISEHTVKNHLTNIFIKLGVSDRAKAIAYVYYKSIS
ncbi:hypothetical protein FTE24_022045 [Saccharibacillus sp. WB 17]|nr:hypothetical protein [Saccharibacillus sp. WB 17]